MCRNIIYIILTFSFSCFRTEKEKKGVFIVKCSQLPKWVKSKILQGLQMGRAGESCLPL